MACSPPLTRADARARVETLVAAYQAAHPDCAPVAVQHAAYGRIPLDALKASPELQALRAFLTTPEPACPAP